MEEVSIGNGPHKKAGLIEEGYHPSLLHLNQVADDLVVKVIDLIKGKEKVTFEGIFSSERYKYSTTPTDASHTHLDPLNPLSHVLLLLLLENEFYEELLKFLIAVVDTHLFKTERRKFNAVGFR